MKKLMIAVAVVALAAVTQAASYTWKVGSGYIYEAGTETKLNSGTAYLFDASELSRQALLTAFNGESFNLATVWGGTKAGKQTVPTGTFSGGRVATSATFSYDNGKAANEGWNAYYAVLSADGKELFISSEKAVVVPLSSTTSIAMANDGTGSKNPVSDTKTILTAGQWYKVAETPVIPEPTSGLLLLLGVAGLALKRKQA